MVNYPPPEPTKLHRTHTYNEQTISDSRSDTPSSLFMYIPPSSPSPFVFVPLMSHFNHPCTTTPACIPCPPSHILTFAFYSLSSPTPCVPYIPIRTSTALTRLFPSACFYPLLFFASFHARLPLCITLPSLAPYLPCLLPYRLAVPVRSPGLTSQRTKLVSCD